MATIIHQIFIPVLVACGSVVFILIMTFLALAAPLHNRKPDIHAPRTNVELEYRGDSLNDRMSRSRWDAKGTKLKFKYR